MKQKKMLLDLTVEQLMEWCQENNQPQYRGKQVFEWVYSKRAYNFESMTNLPKDFRKKLEQTFSIFEELEVTHQEDETGTRKYLFKWSDGQGVETVYLPKNDEYTLCVSSQIGCALGCRFCATARMGIIRNLTPGEILAQILYVQADLQLRDFGNIVFMGMGEPLLNLESVFAAIQQITSDAGLGWSPRRITVSTSGIIPEIKRLGQLNSGINLAVSLNASDEKTRNRLMPINKKYPLKRLLETLKEFPLSGQSKITMEYVMLKNVNDTEEAAGRLSRLLDRRRFKINLIPFNSVTGCRYKGSEAKVIENFQKVLTDRGFSVFIRQSQGSEIDAACGQLASNSMSNQPE